MKLESFFHDELEASDATLFSLQHYKSYANVTLQWRSRSGKEPCQISLNFSSQLVNALIASIDKKNRSSHLIFTSTQIMVS